MFESVKMVLHKTKEKSLIIFKNFDINKEKKIEERKGNLRDKLVRLGTTQDL